MMNHKNHNPGFALSEVLFALAVVATALVAIMGLAANLLKESDRAHRAFERCSAMGSLLTEAHRKSFMLANKPFTREFEDQRLKLIYEARPVPEKSALAELKQLKLERITGESQGVVTTRGTLVSFYYVPEKKPQEGKAPGSKT